MSTEKNEETLLSPIYNVILEVDKAMSGVVYSPMPLEEFQKIKNLQDLQFIYWSEIIQRMHICRATSIKRLKKWYDAFNTAYHANNYYGFCAGLRGLLEACADTFYTTGRIILPVSENFGTIEAALRGNAKRPLFSQTIEDDLIHYIYARKIQTKDDAPDSHSAKHVRMYLDSIKDPDVLSLYSELCEVSHPSLMSLAPFLLPTKEHPLILHEEKIDKGLNDGILDRHKKTILSASNMATGPAMGLLKLINEFDAPVVESLKTGDKALEPMAQSDFWKDLKRRIDESRKAYKQAFP